MDGIVISCRPTYCKAREYIYDVVFRDFWGLDYVIQYCESNTRIKLTFGDIHLEVDDTFFQQAESYWLKTKSLPRSPLQHKIVPPSFQEAVTDFNLPIIYGDRKIEEIFSENYCSIDIFGSAFFMMTRYEEQLIDSVHHLKNTKDLIGQFSAMDSVAYQGGFLERPIINEYLELLWIWIKRFCPQLSRKSRGYSIIPTHDCDSPFWCLRQPWWIKYRSLAGDFLKRRDYLLAWEKIRCLLRLTGDPYNIFSNIMDISEANGLTSYFFFMTSLGRNENDGNYDIFHPCITGLIHDILSRGHKIGIHPGIGSCNHADWFREDVIRMRQMLMREKLDVRCFGGRQHYLDWETANTWKLYENNGLLFDSTMSFVDHIGFRCGICYDYPVYNVLTDEKYNLREYPLEVMECSGLYENFMGLSKEEMIRRCIALKEKVKKYNGIFVILWHNTSLLQNDDFDIYRKVLSG